MRPTLKKLITAILITVSLVTVLSGCSSGSDDESVISNSDNNRIMMTGVLKVGVTDYAPLDQKLEDLLIAAILYQRIYHQALHQYMRWFQ